MAYTFSLQNNSLRIQDSNDNSESLLKAPSIQRAPNYISVLEYGQKVFGLSFPDIGTIDGVTPTDLADIVNKLKSLR